MCRLSRHSVATVLVIFVGLDWACYVVSIPQQEAVESGDTWDRRGTSTRWMLLSMLCAWSRDE